MNYSEKHKEKFGVYPIIIGIFLDDIDNLIKNIIKAIEDNKPYDEYKLLTKEEQKAFDDGSLLF